MLEKLFTNDAKLIMDSISKVGAEARFVGGCVRDALLGIPPKDIDFAANVTPEIILEACKQAGMHVICGNGVRFGTVIVVLNDNNFEITSLRKDLQCDGRHAQVAFTSSWLEDASRRDFTFNAMYVDKDGKLYDFFNGAGDLLAGKIRFIGDAKQRIEEDYLRLLRAMRFYARFAKMPLDEEIVDLCTHYAHKVSSLSGERIWQEVQALFSTSKKLADTLKIMLNTGMMPYVFRGINEQKASETINKLPSPAYAGADTLAKIGCFITLSGAREAPGHWKTSGKVSKFIKNLFDIYYLVPEDDFLNMRNKYLNIYGRNLYNTGLLLLSVGKGHTIRAVEDIEIVPEFPLSSTEIMSLGYEGAQIGQIKSFLLDVWLNSNCLLQREQLLSKLKYTS